MIIADLNNVARVHGSRTVFSGLSWSLQDGERIGLVGPNGVGKSTLLKLTAGVERPDEGIIAFRRGANVAYLPQEYAGEPARGTLAELVAARDDLAAIEEGLAAVAREMTAATGNDEAGFERLLAEQERLLAEFEALGGPTMGNRAKGLLRSLGLADDTWEQPMETLSGGQRKLVGLARCLLTEPDLLLLDEPDNHLDLAGKERLERVIRDFEGAVVVISHDRYLLDETVTTILEMEPARDSGARLQRWEGNYSAYVTQKELAVLKQQQNYVTQQKEIARLEEAVARFKLWASIVIDERHIKQARNKQRQIDRMDKVERPVLERRKMSLLFHPRTRGGAKAVELRGVSKAYGENAVLLGASATVMSGERVGIVGKNGAGKTVLLRLVLGEERPDDGVIWVGPSIEQGRYAQQHETLDLRQTAIESIRAVRPMFEGEAVSQLGRFLIPYTSAQLPIERLSGGEKSRVQLCRLMLSGANCLVLDEPTNNLDIASAEVLEAALDSFPGTVIVVSHDRYFLDRIADRIFEIEDGHLRVFEGGYSYYAGEKRLAPVADPVPGSRVKGAGPGRR